MGAMKRLLEAVCEILQEKSEEFCLMGMDEQWDYSKMVASDVIAQGPKKYELEQQVLRIARERGL